MLLRKSSQYVHITTVEQLDHHAENEQPPTHSSEIKMVSQPNMMRQRCCYLSFTPGACFLDLTEGQHVTYKYIHLPFLFYYVPLPETMRYNLF